MITSDFTRRLGAAASEKVSGLLVDFASFMIARNQSPGSLRACASLLVSAVRIGCRSRDESATRMANLALILTSLHDSTGQAAYLQRAIAADEEALSDLSRDHPERPTLLSNLAAALLTRYEEWGASMDLERARRCVAEAVRTCVPGHQDEAAILHNAAATYRRMAASDPAMHAELEEAVRLDRLALRRSPPGDPQTGDICAGLAVLLLELDATTGDSCCLEEAMARADQAVDIAGRTGGDLGHAQASRGSVYRTVFTHTGDTRALDEAVHSLEVSASLTPKGPLRVRRQAALATNLATRHDVGARSGDLRRAIQLMADCVDQSVDPVSRLNCEANLAVMLLARAESFPGHAHDVARSIRLLRSVADTHPASEFRAIARYHLASIMLERAEQSESGKDPVDAREALRLVDSALSALPGDHLLRADLLVLRGRCRLAMVPGPPTQSITAAAFADFQAAGRTPSAAVHVRVEAALLAAHVQALAANPSTALDAAGNAVELLSALEVRSLLPTDALRMVSELAGSGPDALAMSLEADRVTEGIWMCENLRAIVMGPGPEAFGDMARLRSSYPDHAAQIVGLAGILGDRTASRPAWPGSS